jgi:hypothetical protein
MCGLRRLTQRYCVLLSWKVFWKPSKAKGFNVAAIVPFSNFRDILKHYFEKKNTKMNIHLYIFNNQQLYTMKTVILLINNSYISKAISLYILFILLHWLVHIYSILPLYSMCRQCSIKYPTTIVSYHSASIKVHKQNTNTWSN